MATSTSTETRSARLVGRQLAYEDMQREALRLATLPELIPGPTRTEYVRTMRRIEKAMVRGADRTYRRRRQEA